MSRYHELNELGFRFDHVATERGYISRKLDYKIQPYIGRFGIGVKVMFPRFDTTQYINVEYHIMDSGVLYVAYGCNERGTLYDSFKNCRYSYKLTYKGCSYEYPKNMYNIRLGEWSYLCN